jgi:catechol 2,3-dioxygenase-like lactoylglutathione lyase family enzyme
MAIQVRGMAPLLQVFDMPASIRFYCDVLGFEIVSTDGKPAPNFDWVWLRLNDAADLMLNTRYESDDRPPAPEPSRVAAHDDIGLYFGCPDVDGAYALLSKKGVEAKEPKVAPYGMKQLYLTDPDGYVLCFQHPANP